MALVPYKTTGVGTDDLWTSSASTTGETIRNTENSKFVGLANQGATCYLNGLIQTLFMTPEFRRAVFTWNYSAEKDGSEELCIPLQLQKLFGKLQLRRQRVADTVSLTKSFGWEGYEVFQQQDVQELTRVLFDALEETFKGTPAEHAIDELFGGELVDYLRCIDVDYQSERIDKFLDFSLAIVPFGSNIAMKTLNECIEMFLRPEILDGENKYYAEKYDRRVDAIKGLKFNRLPHIMSIQLKRFVYDFSGDFVVQKKLNDVVKFPFVLDMNKYIAKKRARVHGADGESSDAEVEVENEEFEEFLREQMAKLKHESLSSSTAAASASLLMEDVEDFADPSVPALVAIDDEVAYPMTLEEEREKDSKEQQEQPQEQRQGEKDDKEEKNGETDDAVYGSLSRAELNEMIHRRGEWVYELYAVLVHSGAINGGHYFAYIKDLVRGEWFEFNDSLVSPVSEETVRLAWGAAPLPAYSSSSSSYTSTTGWKPLPRASSTSAYMLLYRKVDRERSTNKHEKKEEEEEKVEDEQRDKSLVVSDELIPSYILESVEREEAEEIARQREEEERRNRLSVRVYWRGKEHFVPSSRTHTLRELLSRVWTELDLSSHSETETETESATKSDAPRLDLFRLRSYNSYTKIMQDVFSAETDAAAERTLESLAFSDYKTYTVEMRSEGAEWDEFIRDGTSVSVEVYQEASHTFSAPHTLRFAPQTTLGDLKDLILQKKIVSWPREELCVLKISTVGQTEAKVELLGEGREHKRLKEDLFVYEGMRIFLERRGIAEVESNDKNANKETTMSLNVNVNGKAQEWKSLSLFLDLRNRISLRIIVPFTSAEPSLSVSSSPLPSSPVGGSAEYAIDADARWSVDTLRAHIAALVDLPVAECRLFKSSLKGAELKQGEGSLSHACLYQTMSIYVTRGVITPAGHFQLSLSELQVSDEELLPGIFMLPSTTESLLERERQEAWEENRYFENEFDSVESVSPTPAVAVPLSVEESEKVREKEAQGYFVSVPCESVHEGEGEGVGEGEDEEAADDDLSQQGHCDFSSNDIDHLIDVLDEPDADVKEGELDAHSEFVGLSEKEAYEQDFPSLQRPAYTEDSFAADETPISENNVAASTAAAVLSEEENVPNLADINPSDFGERSVKNVLDKTQFLSIAGLEPIFAHQNMPIAELRALIHGALVRCGRISPDFSLHRLRLRDQYLRSPGKILRDGKTLSQAGFYLNDSRSISVQLLAEDEVLPDEENGDCMVLVQKFSRSTWHLSQKAEVLICGGWKVKDIARGLATFFDIPFHSLRVLIVPRDTSFYLFELPQQSPPHNYGRSWIDPTGEEKLVRFMSHEMRLVEGDLLVVQDVHESLGALSPADMRSIEIVQLSQQSSSAVSWTTDNISAASKPTWSNNYYTNMYGQYWGSSSYGTAVASCALPPVVSSAPQGIRIKTHKDRLKENEEKKTDSESVTPTQSHKEEKEFEKQGGCALFSDLLS